MIKPYEGKSGFAWQVYGRRDGKKVYVGTFESEREAKIAERRFIVTQEQITAGELPPELDLDRTVRRPRSGSRRSRRVARARMAATPTASASTSCPS